MKTIRFLRRLTCSLFTAAVAITALPTISHADVPTPAGMQKAFINDPVFNLDAVEVFIPLGWHFQGTLVQGTSAMAVPFPVFRASSPDGLVVLEKLPRMDWKWGTSPAIAREASDCLPLRQKMAAQEFLKYLASTMNVEYLADEAVPADQLAAANQGLQSSAVSAQYTSNGMQPPTQSVDLARAVVRYKNGSFVMKGLLSASIYYSRSVIRGPRGDPWETNLCIANVRYVHAPEAQYAAAVKQLDPQNAGAVTMPDWQNAWSQNAQRLAQIRMGQIKAYGDKQIAMIKANGEQFRHSQDVRQQMHQEFMSTMQRGTNMSMNRASQIANTNHTNSSNWVDYSLDQQTVRDPNTGQISKVSSSNSYTWLDGNGKVSYQTNDVNANPNGVLQGNWTRQTVVNGDGTSR